jgi:bifunctional polynucleotide phosphatase/kinase
VVLHIQIVALLVQCYISYTLSNHLKQREKCLKAAAAFIEDGTSVVVGEFPVSISIKPHPPPTVTLPLCSSRSRTDRHNMTDNTNADPDTRAQWITLAKKLNVPIRCTLFTAPMKLCEHNDAVRAMNLGFEVSCASITTFTTVLEPYPKVPRSC